MRPMAYDLHYYRLSSRRNTWWRVVNALAAAKCRERAAFLPAIYVAIILGEIPDTTTTGYINQ